jgi:hypothetical protein
MPIKGLIERHTQSQIMCFSAKYRTKELIGSRRWLRIPIDRDDRRTAPAVLVSFHLPIHH